MSPNQIPAQSINDKNRANAERSTGPRTLKGKKRSSLNALRHGLTSKVVVLADEDPREYRRHVECFLDEYDPQGATESQLVQSLIDTSWRLNRILALETKILSGDSDLEAQTKMLANLSLYSQRLARQFEKTLAQLRELQQEKPAPNPPTAAIAPAPGFVFSAPQPKTHEAPKQAAAPIPIRPIAMHGE